ncbi:MAG: fumarate hydratase [Candidatus Saganbacteria bacterium]|nr:fumarate hydratase [Candidatus Saganbacteria bacterium]
MRKISAEKIKETIESIILEVAFNLPEDVCAALESAHKKEASKLGKSILKDLVDNIKVAKDEKLPLCQDTGFVVIFMEIGQEVQIEGDLHKAINEAVAKAYQEGYLRKSIVSDPIQRKNSGDNTPAIVYTEIVPGDKIKIKLLTKGGGAENCSAIRMFNPTVGAEEIEKFVIETVKNAGPNACPPIIVGIGIGGTFDKAAQIAKKSLFRKIGTHNSKPHIAKMEESLLGKINKTGIGPGGLGGKITALAVNTETFPCHIASLPVAVNIECHSHRHKEVTI